MRNIHRYNKVSERELKIIERGQNNDGAEKETPIHHREGGD